MMLTAPPEIDGKLAREEFEHVTEDLAAHGWRSALERSRRRLDAEAEAAIDASSVKPACKEGCWYCCYYRVTVHPEEAFAIVEYVRAHFDQNRGQRVREDVAANAKALRRMSHQEQLVANLKCPFLDDGRCSIYPVRPTRCRNFHAIDVDGCRRSYEEPNVEVPNSFVDGLRNTTESVSEGYGEALRRAGFDTSVAEMNAALAACLTAATPRERFERKKRAFSVQIID
jgi:Fe-S-cluster containining protein